MKTWIDSKTGLEWQVKPATKPMTHAEAKKYAARLKVAGGGWRLPTKDELETISGKNRPGELDGAGFYWSSSPVEDDVGSAWYIGFYHGYVVHSAVNYGGRVRCVR